LRGRRTRSLSCAGGICVVGARKQAVGGKIDSRLTALGVSPEFGIAVGVGSLFTASVNSAFIDNQTTPQGSVMHTWTRGALTLRSGADLRFVMLNVANISSGTPSYTFNASPVGANGIFGVGPATTQATSLSARLPAYGVNTGPKTPMRGYRSRQQEYFAQGDWRVRRDLTLNLGLRYSTSAFTTKRTEPSPIFMRPIYRARPCPT
jgi:outer membrane receptor protein involved in Fe transport